LDQPVFFLTFYATIYACEQVLLPQTSPRGIESQVNTGKCRKDSGKREENGHRILRLKTKVLRHQFNKFIYIAID
jgi:hypothetical protein